MQAFVLLQMYKYLKLKYQVTFNSLLMFWETADRIREDGDFFNGVVIKFFSFRII